MMQGPLSTHQNDNLNRAENVPNFANAIPFIPNFVPKLVWKREMCSNVDTYRKHGVWNRAKKVG
jgi:hypothetical protein